MTHTYRVFRWYTGGSAYGPERWAIRQDGTLEPADILSTQSGADYAAHALNIGACHVERHRPLGARVQPGAPREVIEQRARELAAVIRRNEREADARRLLDGCDCEDPSYTHRASCPHYSAHRATLHAIGRDTRRCEECGRVHDATRADGHGHALDCPLRAQLAPAETPRTIGALTGLPSSREIRTGRHTS